MAALDQVDNWSPPNTAVGWISTDGASDRHGPTAMEFELASITKALFAYAILVATEEGTLSLDATQQGQKESIGSPPAFPCLRTWF